MLFENLDLTLNTPNVYSPETPDLRSLFDLIVSEGVVSVLEFGSGWSTLAIAAALEENKNRDTVPLDFRHPNPFKLLTVDCSEEYLNYALSRLDFHALRGMVDYHLTTARMSEHLGVACHFFDSLPPFTADLIYLDGPDASQVLGDLGGISSKFGDGVRDYGLPMSADILRMEFYLWPGTFIVTDGRGANAEFLRRHLSREWSYHYSIPLDQHFFRLDSAPWGRHSRGLAGRRSDRTLPRIVHDLELATGVSPNDAGPGGASR
jgi:hypothetical protein